MSIERLIDPGALEGAKPETGQKRTPPPRRGLGAGLRALSRQARRFVSRRTPKGLYARSLIIIIARWCCSSRWSPSSSWSATGRP